MLDEVYRILRYIKTTPALSRAYKVTDELFDLSSMAMEYFKEHIEPRLPEITCFSSEFLDVTTRYPGLNISCLYIYDIRSSQLGKVKSYSYSNKVIFISLLASDPFRGLCSGIGEQLFYGIGARG